MGAGRGLARVRRAALAACMTCPLCQGLLREASAVAECLHTFCRGCIMEKINDEQIDSCPVCDIDLGGDPEEKLRPDHNIQDIRNKVFPLKRTTADAPKSPTVTLPVKRKQRSLSSLVVGTPRVATKTGLTGRRTNSTRTPSSRATPPSNNGTMKLPNKSEGQDQMTEKIPASQSTKTTTAYKKQNSTDTESSSQPSAEGRKNGKTIEKEELQKPLSSLAEAAGRMKSLRSTHKSQVAKEDKIKMTKRVIPVRKDDKEDKTAITGTRVSIQSSRLKLQEEIKGNSSESSSLKDKKTTEKKLRKFQHEASRQELLSSVKTGALYDGVVTPVWFSLVASPNRKEGSQLPQLPKNYLRIKDGNLQISSIQRYITNKLELSSEDEVEITCHGETICPSTTLQTLLEMWLRSEPAEQVQATLGASAKEFLMVLGYRRRQRPLAS